MTAANCRVVNKLIADILSDAREVSPKVIKVSQVSGSGAADEYIVLGPVHPPLAPSSPQVRNYR